MFGGSSSGTRRVPALAPRKASSACAAPLWPNDALAGPDVTKLAVQDLLAPREAARLLEELPGTLGDDPDGRRREAWRRHADAALRGLLP